MRRRQALVGSIAIALCGPAPSAAAQSSAAAELAFREGRDLMNKGRHQEACPKFEESQRLDPAPGTQLNLADCYEKTGRTATAWETFRAAETAAIAEGQRDFALEARKRAEVLQPKLCKLAITVADGAATGVEIALDGKPATRLVGSAVPVDPGAHTIEASAAGKQTWRHTVRVDKPGTTETVEVPALVALARPPAAPVAEVSRPQPTGRRHRMTPLAWGLAIGGGAALVVGVSVGGTAYRDLRDCRDQGGCASQDQLDGIKSRLLVGDLLIGAGVAAAGGALFAWWFGGERDEARSLEVVATPQSAAVLMVGTF